MNAVLLKVDEEQIIIDDPVTLDDVIDQPHEIQVHITQNDIELGVRDNVLSCPISIAVKRQFPDWTVTTNLCFIYLVNESNHLAFTMPEDGFRFVKDFDLGRNVKPFELKANTI